MHLSFLAFCLSLLLLHCAAMPKTKYDEKKEKKLGTEVKSVGTNTLEQSDKIGSGGIGANLKRIGTALLLATSSGLGLAAAARDPSLMAPPQPMAPQMPQPAHPKMTNFTVGNGSNFGAHEVPIQDDYSGHKSHPPRHG